MEGIKRDDDAENMQDAEGNQAFVTPDQMPEGLISKNVRIHQKRTSVRLEPQMWNALKEISALEDASVHDLCSAVHDLKNPAMPFTAALRVFLMEYYRSAARASHYVTQVQRLLKEPRPTPVLLPVDEAGE